MLSNIEISRYDRHLNKQLEPRLIEFLKKKEYYRENGMDENQLNKKYCITKKDLILIDNIMHQTVAKISNRKKNNRLDKNMQDIQDSNNDQFWDEIKKNKEYFNVNTKLANSDNVCKINKEKQDFRNGLKNKQLHQSNIYNNVTPKIRFKDYLPYGENEELTDANYSLDNIIGKLDKLKKTRDVDVENYLAFGSSTNEVSSGYTRNAKAKSIGYPNPAEHYFDYISEDMQFPDHTVIERSVSTRLLNKSFKEDKYSREMK